MRPWLFYWFFLNKIFVVNLTSVKIDIIFFTLLKRDKVIRCKSRSNKPQVLHSYNYYVVSRIFAPNRLYHV